jgi:hypothetical protein
LPTRSRAAARAFRHAATSARTSSPPRPRCAAARADAGRRAVLAEHLAQRAGPLAGGAPALAQAIEAGMMFSSRRPRARSSSSAALDRVAASRARATPRASLDLLASTAGVDREDRLLAAGQRRRLGLGER